MADTHHLITTDLEALAAVREDGEPVVVAAERVRMIDRLVERDAGLRFLFARPALRRDAAAGLIGKLAWYTDLDTEHQGKGRPMDELDGETRAGAEAALRRALDAVHQHLDDPALGRLLGRALLIPSLHDVMVINGSVVLSSWGFVPRGVDPDDPAALARHFRDTLATYCDFIPDLDAGPASPGGAGTTAAAVEVPMSTDAGGTAALPRQVHDDCPLWYRSVGFLAFYAITLFALGVLVGWYLHPSDFDAYIGLNEGRIAEERAINDGLEKENAALETALEGFECPGPGNAPAPADAADPAMPEAADAKRPGGE